MYKDPEPVVFVLPQGPIVVVNKPRLGLFTRFLKWLRSVGDLPRCPLCFDHFEPKQINEGGGYFVAVYCRSCQARARMFHNPPQSGGTLRPRPLPTAIPSSGQRILM